MILSLLNEETEYKSAVAMIHHGDKWLLGLAKNPGDDRNHKWCFVGGGIKSGETPKQAAKREAREESGIICQPKGQIINRNDKKSVAFVECTASSCSEPKPNHEFVIQGWFTTDDMRGLVLHDNVRDLISRVKRR